MISQRVYIRSLVLVIAALLLVGMAQVWVHLQVIVVGYQLSQANQKRQALTELQQRLTIELRTRSDLALVERMARERLQMSSPDPRTIRHVTIADATASTGTDARGGRP